MLWDEPKIFFLERRYFFSIILSEFLKNRVALQWLRLMRHEDTQKSRVKAEKTKIFFQKASSGFGDVSFKERSGRFKA